MKAVLSFKYDTDNPDEKREIDLIQQATLWKLMVWDLDQWFRQKLKHENAGTEMEDARKQLRELLAEYHLSLDE
jgi:hypothetical protein